MRIRVVDSHTGGEPTRVVLEGGPSLGGGSMAEQRDRLRSEHDRFRTAIVGEPRGSEAMVGALLCEPQDPASAAGVVFFDNGGYLGMCGHGTIGLVVTLAHLGRIGIGRHRIETPSGVVTAELLADGRVAVDNVPSWRAQAGVALEIRGHGTMKGDVAFGGNWFFLTEDHGQLLDRGLVESLIGLTGRIREALVAAGVVGDGGAEVDHIGLFARSDASGLDSRDFILCPGGAYDRSPCGTGTSAKLACLAGDGRLAPGELWRQESITGSVFEASFAVDAEHPSRIRPRITGAAHVTAEATLLLDERDPLRWGTAWASTS